MVIRHKTTTAKEGWFPSLILKFAHAQCLHCAAQCHYSFFFFHLCQTLDTLFKTCLWWAQQGTKESFERNFNMKKNALTFFLFNIAWTLLCASAHAQNCPTRLTMYHLFSLDPIVGFIWQTSNAFKPILLAVCLQPTVVDNRYVGKEIRGGSYRLCQKIVYLLGFF